MVNDKSSSAADKPMSVAEARSIRWLRNKQRPLGELLDEGYLNERRLAWAAEKAYDPKLRQAAAVLLDSLRSETAPQPAAASAADPEPAVAAIQIQLGLEQARATKWPFRPFRGQAMGPLVESHQIGLKDLAHAIENAWDERVRRAAVALMARRLQQSVQEPPPDAGPLRVISCGESHSERQRFRWITVQGMILGALITLTIWMIVVAVRSLEPGRTQPGMAALISPAGLVALAIVLALMAVAMWLFNRLLDAALGQVNREIDAYRKGQEGEERVVETLRQNLDGTWSLFRNVPLPDRKGDIDAILIGPPGVWTLEVKNYSGEHRNVGEHWERRVGGRWHSLRKSPSRQAQRNAVALSNFLRASGMAQWVEPAVVWANQESPLTVESPMVAVWLLDRLPEELGNLWQQAPMGAERQAEIVEHLTALQKTQQEGG